MKPVRIWLLIGVIMIVIQVLLGGITRLTGSGLSITEWDVLSGSLPPLNEQQWQAAFEKYKQTPQFQYVNFDFGMDDFRFIYFWEWLHRNWARFIGVIFAVPFVIFLIQKRFKKEMAGPLVILFLLGALQGAVGWIMVASGLTGDAVYVAPVRLAMHFVFALILLFYTYRVYLDVSIDENQRVYDPFLKNLTTGIISLLFLQLIYGALLAGYRAANAAPTWPDINGMFIPGGISGSGNIWSDLFENKITIQFIHRSIAYLLFILTGIWTWKSFRLPEGSLPGKSKWVPFILITIQLVLGIWTVLTSVKIVPNHWGIFEWMAQLHQLAAMFFFLSMIRMSFLLKRKASVLD